MSASFLDAVAMRAIEAASDRPLPTDDALAALELHGSVVEIEAGVGVWGALLRKRNLVHWCGYDSAPPTDALTHVLPGGPNMASHHTDRTLLLVRGLKNPADSCTALAAFVEAGGTTVAHVGGELGGPSSTSADAEFSAMLAEGCFERNVTVALASSSVQLTFWQRRLPLPAAIAVGDMPPPTACGVLDVRLELVDMEAPEWANPPPAKPVEGPFKPEIGGRSIRPTMSREEMRKQFEASLPDGF